MRLCLPYILLTTVLLFPCPLLAGESGEPLAAEHPCPTQRPQPETTDHRTLTLHGLACFEARRYDWALTHYRAAYALNADPVLLATIGRSFQELGLYDLALTNYQAFLARESQTPAAERIRGRIRELEEAREDNGATIRLIASPPGHEVALVNENGDWIELGLAPAEMSLRAGTYEFVFTGEGYLPRHEKIRISSGQTRTIRTHLISEDAAFNISTRNIRRAGILTLGVSVPATAAGITLLALSSQTTTAALELDREFSDLSDYDARRRELLDDAADYRRWGTIGTGIGATGMIIGALLLSTSSSPSKKNADQIDPSDESFPRQAQRSLFFEPLLSPTHLGFQIRY